MTFVVFAYNFEHWKTQAGLFNLFMNGYTPDMVILQGKKQLNFRQSEYRITPKGEYLINPKQICKKLGFRFMVCDHDDYRNDLYYESDYGVILGARILKQSTIEQYKGIINVHPGILPGNRGLDNLKWSLILGLPVGVTSHFIDYRIDMGTGIMQKQIEIESGDSIRDLYIKQRNAEQEVLIKTMKLIDEGLPELQPIPYSPKFDAVPIDADYQKLINERTNNIPELS